MKLIDNLFRKLHTVSCLALLISFTGISYLKAKVNQPNEYLTGGTVASATFGEALPGITIVVKGTSVETNSDGVSQYFFLIAPGNNLFIPLIAFGCEVIFESPKHNFLPLSHREVNMNNNLEHYPGW